MGELPVPPVPAEMQERLRTRLSAAAEDAGLLDVAYRPVPTPVGELLLAATPQGLVQVSYADPEQALAELAQAVSPRVLRDGNRLDEPRRQLDEYFAGTRRGFDLPLDLRLSTGFRRRVLDQLRGIDYGSTRSYADVAAAAGSPRAVRAVGSACATNPLPVVVPCHRVVRSDGSPGGYAGGPEAKRLLLELEGDDRER